MVQLRILYYYGLCMLYLKRNPSHLLFSQGHIVNIRMSSKMLFTYQQHFCRQVQSLLFLKDEPHIKLVQNGLDLMTYLKKKA